MTPRLDVHDAWAPAPGAPGAPSPEPARTDWGGAPPRRVRIGTASCIAALLAGLAAGACRRPAPSPPAMAPVAVLPAPPLSPWPGTLATALRSAEVGKYDEAEDILSRFSVEHAGTADGAESDFWRALLKTAPDNRKATPRESMALYDAYLSGGPGLPRHAEAQLLRRLVEVLDSTRTLVVTMRASYESRERARDDEMRRLNDALDRTTAELERIKRRLTPKPQ
ncbi:MAG TPA: hypothetical protein VFV33_18310 [Gemmatimonadaceae bacterium]|nr:hypothetical protein [Gemmatimonadaceae bacterium]